MVWWKSTVSLHYVVDINIKLGFYAGITIASVFFIHCNATTENETKSA